MQRPTSGGVSTFETVQSLAELVCKLSLGVIIAITAYYVFATMTASDQLFRGMLTFSQPMSFNDFQRHVTNLHNLTMGLQMAALIGAVAALIRFYDYPEGG